MVEHRTVQRRKANIVIFVDEIGQFVDLSLIQTAIKLVSQPDFDYQ